MPLPLDLVEMGAPDGLQGRVVSISDCPRIKSGPGRVVLTTVNHLNNACRDLTVKTSSGLTEMIRTTDYHQFWSETKQGWVQAYTLSIGDRLQGSDGESIEVIGNERNPGIHRVYNLTVETDHIYRVGLGNTLVHNQNCSPEVRRGRKKGSGGKEHKKGKRNSTKDKHQKGKGRRKRDRGNEKGDKRRPY